MTGYIPRWFTAQTVTHPSTNPVEHVQDLNSRPVDHESDTLTTTLPVMVHLKLVMCSVAL